MMNLEGLQLISVGHVRPNPQWGMPPHWHPFHEMIVVQSGVMTVNTARKTVRACTGSVLLYPAEVTHEELNDQQEPVETLFISFVLPNIMPSVLMHTPDRHQRITWLVQQLYAERYTLAKSAAYLRHSLTQAMVSEFLCLTEYQEPGLVEQIRAYIREHIASSLSLEELASVAHMSKYHFSRCYHRLAGHAPMDDVRRLRAEAARDLLLSMNLPLKAIAPRVGLCNEHHLSRLIKQYLGVPASVLRKRVSWEALPEIEEHG